MLTRVALAATVIVTNVLGCGAKTGLPTPERPERQSASLVRYQRVGGLDLLFVVDSSRSMADKQRELARRVPQLIKAFTDPDVDPVTGIPRAPHVADLHVAVISSSLGPHGTSSCGGATNPDDRAHLLPRAGEKGEQGYFLKDGSLESASCGATVAASPVRWVYDPRRDKTARFAGAKDSAALQTEVSCIIDSVGESGCGLEETLEAMYRFLVDPAPYLTASVDCPRTTPSGDVCGDNPFVVSGLDAELLAQRKAFLRPDSLLAVIIVSDENDVSTNPAGKNWLPWARTRRSMPRGFGACANVPDDVEPDTDEAHAKVFADLGCKQCEPGDLDINCSTPWPREFSSPTADSDLSNLRGFHQLQRFGRNYLWPVSRYVSGFKAKSVLGSDGRVGPNPIFAGGLRSRELVVVAGIVGVPKHLVAAGDWDKMISTDLTRRDPHMIESIAPRPGLPKYAGDHTIDPISGGERDTFGNDPQYACIGPRVSTEVTHTCEDSDDWTRDPVCAKDGTQPRFRAFPGIRHLRLLRDLGQSGLVASICDDTLAPAIEGITARLQQIVGNQCFLGLTVPPAVGGVVDCVLVETFATDTHEGAVKCESIGPARCTPGSARCRAGASMAPTGPAYAAYGLRVPVAVGDNVELVDAYEDGGNVYAKTSDGARHLVCETAQLVGPTAAGCRGDPSESVAGHGWCVTNDPAVIGEQCLRAGAKELVRFVGEGKPKGGATVGMVCSR
jgi:hypothetical protein